MTHREQRGEEAALPRVGNTDRREHAATDAVEGTTRDQTFDLRVGEADVTKLGSRDEPILISCHAAHLLAELSARPALHLCFVHGGAQYEPGVTATPARTRWQRYGRFPYTISTN